VTSRPLSDPGTPATTQVVAGPGDRPHLPPVESSTTSRRNDRRAPLAWLPWLLLGLLALTLLAAALLARAAGSSDDAAGSSETSSSAERAAEREGDAGAALSAGGQDLLAVSGGKVGRAATSRPPRSGSPRSATQHPYGPARPA
jgi:hypothetical protein